MPIEVTEKLFTVDEYQRMEEAYDMQVKLPHFAAAGIPEVWIEDVRGELVLVYRDPVQGDYTTALVLRAGDSVSPIAFPDVMLRVEDLLGPPDLFDQPQ